MKTSVHTSALFARRVFSTLFIMPVVVGLHFSGTPTVSAGGFSLLHNFGTNDHGVQPLAGLTVGEDGYLYGTTAEGGQGSRGQLFKVRPDGTDYTALKNFDGRDGAYPEAELVWDAGWLYGVTSYGGSNDLGTIFKVRTNGQDFTVLRDFNIPEGHFPQAGLLVNNGVLYGTAYSGGDDDYGTLYRLQVDGTDFTVLKRFDGTNGCRSLGGLTRSGDWLYGTTTDGGSNQCGVVFSIQTDGSGYSVLHHFELGAGGFPRGDLVLNGTNLFGTTAGGGTNGTGVIYRVNTDGTGFVVLHDFGDGSQGSAPQAGVWLDGQTLYGATFEGGNPGYGVIFKLQADGMGYEVLKNLDDWWIDGGYPQGVVLVGGTNLCGALAEGGGNGYGALFSVSTDGSDYRRIYDCSGGDGNLPVGKLLLAEARLYGVTEGGGVAGGGTIFSLGTNGNDYRVSKDFTNALEGYQVASDLRLAGNTLFGATSYGGENDAGVLFRVETDGSGFVVLKYFGGTNSMYPRGGLLLKNDVLYGVTCGAGTEIPGALFKIGTNGDGFAFVKQFDGEGEVRPNEGLLMAGDFLYGSTIWGGTYSQGTIYRIHPDGTGYEVLKEFDGSDGSGPQPGMALSGATLYGVTGGGGQGYGTLFKINLDGTGFAVLHVFDWETASQPVGDLILSGDKLYGATVTGGAYGGGTVYCINTNGSSFGILKNFDFSACNPQGALLLYGETIYGTVTGTGGNDSGAVFALRPGLPQIDRQPESGTVSLGAWTQLSAAVAGYPPATVQWYFNATNEIAGATNLILELPDVQLEQSGNYTLVAANEIGSVTSLVAVLHVSIVPPNITMSPADQAGHLGATAQFSVMASGSPPLSYQWLKDGHPLADDEKFSGCQTNVLAVANLFGGDQGGYAVIVSNSVGSVTSRVATLRVNLVVADDFDPGLSPASGVSSLVQALVVQPDGKILVGGSFVPPGQSMRFGLVRLNSDGSVDSTFTSTPNAFVSSVHLLADGKILIGGGFVIARENQYRFNLARLNPDGSLDTNFNCSANDNVYTLAAQPNRKVVVGGRFSQVGGQNRACLARLNADGSLDSTFNPGCTNAVLTMTVQSDGRILVGGSFWWLAGTNCYNLGRLEDNGTLDFSYQPMLSANGIYEIARQQDDKLLVAYGMEFLRLNHDGTRDTSFAAVINNPVLSATCQPDGKILIGGVFTSVGGEPHAYLARLNTNGAVDVSFGAGANNWVRCLARQPNGDIVVGGDFTLLDGQPRTLVGRLIECQPPTLTTSLPDRTAEVGSTVSFKVQTTGRPVPQCGWFWNGVPLANTNTVLTLTNLQTTQAGTYTVGLSNAAGRVSSAPINLLVVPPVARRNVPGLSVAGDVGSLLYLESTAALGESVVWTPRDTITIQAAPQWWFDLTEPLPGSRFYRTWQIGNPTVAPRLQLNFVPALTLTGQINDEIRVEGINASGPTGAWFQLATVTLTNSPQLYFDVSAIGQPARLYRLTLNP